MSTNNPITIQDVYAARKRIAPYITRTPLVEAPLLSEITGAKRMMLKLENLQRTGSFKPRGVANKLLSLSKEQLKRGVIAVSSGNHGRAIAYMANELGGKAVICLAEGVAKNKMQAISDLGAEIVIGGATYDEATHTMERLQKERGLSYCGSFDDPHLLAGHASVGIELLEDFPEVDTVLVPSAIGVLPIGIAIVLKRANPAVRIVAVSMERGAVLVPSLRAGKLVDYVEEPTLADALVGGLGPRPEHVIETVSRYIDDTILVSEDDIAAAMYFALDNLHQVIEGAGAVGIAALLRKKTEHLGRNIAVVVSGGNVDLPVLADIVERATSA